MQFYTILMAHADDLQAVSVDEALVDVTGSVARMKESSTMMDVDVFSDNSADPAKELAELIRSKIRKVTQCEGVSMFVPFAVHRIDVYCEQRALASPIISC